MEGYILAEKDDINAKITEDSSPDDAEKKENTQNFFKNVLKTSGDIAKEKQIYNSGNYIGNNQAKNLMIIENAVINGGMSLNDYNIKDVTTNVRNVDKVYDLSIAEEFAEFGEKVKGGEHFAVAVILCVFEYVELDDLQDLKLKLLNEFPKTIDEEGNEIAIRQNPFISIDSLLKTINGKMFVLDNGTNCIGLGKNRPQALKNLWQQFPSLRSSIARWMINVSDTFQYRTNFKTAQITNAFVNVLKMDFNAGVNHFFQRFVSDSEKYILLGLIAIELYNDINYRQKILPFIKQWADSSSSWKWKSALYVYSNIKYEERDAEFDNKVRKSIINLYSMIERDDWRKENMTYIRILLISFERTRTLISEVLNEWINNMHGYKNKQMICIWYLELLTYEYYKISGNQPNLALVVCDKKQQLENLLPVVNATLQIYDARKCLFLLLESYLKEISKYDITKKTLNGLKAFFQLTYENNPRFQRDIILFLRKCNCRLADEIKNFIEKKLSLQTSEKIRIESSEKSESNGGSETSLNKKILE